MVRRWSSVAGNLLPLGILVDELPWTFTSIFQPLAIATRPFVLNVALETSVTAILTSCARSLSCWYLATIKERSLYESHSFSMIGTILSFHPVWSAPEFPGCRIEALRTWVTSHGGPWWTDCTGDWEVLTLVVIWVHWYCRGKHLDSGGADLRILQTDVVAVRT